MDFIKNGTKLAYQNLRKFKSCQKYIICILITTTKDPVPAYSVQPLHDLLIIIFEVYQIV